MDQRSVLMLLVTIIWLIDVGGYGQEFHDNVFRRHRQIRTRVIHDKELKLSPIPNSLIICNRSVPYGPYLDRYGKTNTPFAVAHLSDEYLRDDRSFLHWSNQICRLVFRGHYDPKLKHDHRIFTLPVGWRDGMKLDQIITKASRRPLQWSFAGDPYKSDRRTALRTLSREWPGASSSTHFFKGFNSPKALSPIEYGKLLSCSQFVVCPRGWKNLETFRVYEALSAGAIPITLSRTRWQPEQPHYWARVFFETVDVPFIHADTWQEAIVKARCLSENNKILDSVQAECVKFWSRYKSQLHARVGKALIKAFSQEKNS